MFLWEAGMPAQLAIGVWAEKMKCLPTEARGRVWKVLPAKGLYEWRRVQPDCRGQVFVDTAIRRFR